MDNIVNVQMDDYNSVNSNESQHSTMSKNPNKDNGLKDNDLPLFFGGLFIFLLLIIVIVILIIVIIVFTNGNTVGNKCNKTADCSVVRYVIIMIRYVWLVLGVAVKIIQIVLVKIYIVIMKMYALLKILQLYPQLVSHWDHLWVHRIEHMCS